jgi:hypothetical protein
MIRFVVIVFFSAILAPIGAEAAKIRLRAGSAVSVPKPSGTPQVHTEVRLPFPSAAVTDSVSPPRDRPGSRQIWCRGNVVVGGFCVMN